MSLIVTAAAVSTALGWAGSGKTAPATDAEVSLAQAVIEDFIGVDITTDGQSTRLLTGDIVRLQNAVRWQTMHLRNHPEVLSERSDVESASANGASIRYRAEADGLLHPLALRCVRRLSWRKRVKTTVAHVPRDRSLRGQDMVHDNGREPWVPL